MLLPPRRLAEHPASGERKGLGEGGEEEAEEAKGSATQPDVDPVEGPRPPGASGKLWLPPPSPGSLAGRGSGDGAAPLPVPEVRVKEGTQRDTPGLPGQGGGQPLRGPWVGWVGCRLREGALSKWKPGLGNWPDHSHCTASGETPLLLKGARPPTKKNF